MLGSLILTHSWNGTVRGPEGFAARRLAAGDPPVLRLPHHGRHRLLMLVVVVAGQAVALRAARLYAVALVPAPVPDGPRRSASSRCLAGWTTTEVGRQPWTVYGLLRTADFGVAVAHRLERARLAGSATSSCI